MSAQALSVPDKHALRIAHDTMRLHCAGALILGGPNHRQAAETILRLTDKRAPEAGDCTCPNEEATR